MDHELDQILEALKNEGLEQFSVEFFGQKMGFTEYSHVLIQHECAHFGQWANYAAFGEFFIDSWIDSRPQKSMSFNSLFGQSSIR